MPQPMAATSLHHSDVVRALGDMRALVLIEAGRIGTVQDFLVREGLARERDAGELRRAKICESIARLLDICESDRVIMDRLATAIRDRARAP